MHVEGDLEEIHKNEVEVIKSSIRELEAGDNGFLPTVKPIMDGFL